MALKQNAKSIARRPRILARVEARSWSRRKREVRARGSKKRGKRKSDWDEEGIRRVRAKLGRR